MNSRRAFIRTLGAGTAGAFAASYLPRADAETARWMEVFQQTGLRPLLLHNNENPLGPGTKVLGAVRAFMRDGAPAGRYPGNPQQLREAIAAKYKISTDNVLVGCGSTQLLRTATHAFTSPSRGLVSGAPAYEECADYANLVGAPVKAIPLDPQLRDDLDAIVAAVAAMKDAGMVYLNNPNNPTATVHSGKAVSSFIDRVLQASPQTNLLIDEAYFDYVTDPGYATQIPIALANPRVVVARTFSKAHGMAGLRVGYMIGRPETLRPMQQWQYGTSMNALGVAAAIASIGDDERIAQERNRNTEARDFTVRWFERAGFKVSDSQANFIFVDLKRPLAEFRDPCRERGVLVGRPFPPMTTHCRISISTIDDMRKAVGVFGDVLGVKATQAA
ncbi:MAG: pyridoxal phosphate-dependent aminotransferase [Vicinamibacterales bacterium]